MKTAISKALSIILIISLVEIILEWLSLISPKILKAPKNLKF